MKLFSGFSKWMSIFLVAGMLSPSQVYAEKPRAENKKEFKEISLGEAKENNLEKLLLKKEETPNYISQNNLPIRNILASDKEEFREIYFNNLSQIIIPYSQGKGLESCDRAKDKIAYLQWIRLHTGANMPGARPYDQNHLAIFCGDRFKPEKFYLVLLAGDIVQKANEEQRLDTEEKLKSYAKRNNLSIKWLHEKFSDVPIQIEARKEKEKILKYLGLEGQKAEFTRFDFDEDGRSDYLITKNNEYYWTDFYFVRNGAKDLESFTSSFKTLDAINNLKIQAISEEGKQKLLVTGQDKMSKQPRAFYILYKDQKIQWGYAGSSLTLMPGIKK